MTDLDALYAAPLSQFTALRNELARAAGADGDRALATEIKALKKPSVSAWVVNRLARDHRDAMQELIGAGVALEEAMQRSFAGEPSQLPPARERESAAIAHLRMAATEVMPDITASTLERVTNSLMSGARSREGRDLLLAGCLTTDLEPRGFDVYRGFAIPPPSDTTPGEKPSRPRGARRRSSDETASVPEASAGGPESAIEERKATLRSNLTAARDRSMTAEADAAQVERRASEAKTVAARLAADAEQARSRATAMLAEVSRIESELEGLDRG
jgi:hypothetical protein